MPRNSSSPLDYELHGSAVHEVLSFTPTVAIPQPLFRLAEPVSSERLIVGGGPWNQHMVDMTLSRLWESASLSLSLK